MQMFAQFVGELKLPIVQGAWRSSRSVTFAARSALLAALPIWRAKPQIHFR
jgi:hypothetical protein